MPIRREGDQRTEIGNWDSWIERELADARARGEFDNLPGAGKPLDIASTAVNPEWDLAFSRLKNAGVAPAWMELDRACHAQRAELDAFLDRSGRYLAAQIALLDVEPPAVPPIRPAPRWQVWKRIGSWLQLPADPAADASPLDRLDLVRMRATMKAQYLERAARLDKSIVEFNSSLSKNLERLERMRMLPARAARLFEEGCPPIA